MNEIEDLIAALKKTYETKVQKSYNQWEFGYSLERGWFCMLGDPERLIYRKSIDDLIKNLEWYQEGLPVSPLITDETRKEEEWDFEIDGREWNLKAHECIRPKDEQSTDFCLAHDSADHTDDGNRFHKYEVCLEELILRTDAYYKADIIINYLDLLPTQWKFDRLCYNKYDHPMLGLFIHNLKGFLREYEE